MKTTKIRRPPHVAIALTLSASILGCSGEFDESTETLEEAVGEPSPDQVPLDPLTIPKFANQLAIPRVFAPTPIVDRGRVIRNEYTVSVAETTAQMLPPGFPATTVLAYGGRVRIPGSSATEFVRAVPGPIFENTAGIPSLVRYRNEIDTPHFMPVDPTLHWANPNAFEPPVAPFQPFPPGYPASLFPVPHVTHMHGLMVPAEQDGTAEMHFTRFGQVGPTFSTRDYLMPNDQFATQLFYHDHVVGMTRLDVISGVVGTGYFIRDPANEPLDAPNSPLPRGRFEIPLVFFNRSFFTDGEINFPRTGLNAANPYWTVFTGAPFTPGNTVLVNGKVWPNLNVERRQYRFRMLAADNFNGVYNFAFDNGMPFTIIGSDGGYLPAPQVVTSFGMGITERADVLVDFSGLAPGTKVVLRDTDDDPATLGTLMQFTVLDTPPVPPPPLNPALFPELPELIPDAPTRIKTLNVPVLPSGAVQVLLDGLNFTGPITEYPLVGSTEQWDLVQMGPLSHEIHIHLIEFQVLERQPINSAAYLAAWQLANGITPISRAIVVDPTPFFTGPPQPPLPYDTGWKDTVRTPGNMVTRIRARWAPQELPTGGSAPGRNDFPVDPTTGPGYLWHCHVLAHEDLDMMRRMPLVNAWRANVDYQAGIRDRVGTTVAHQNINYRVRRTHRSRADEPPNRRFDLWERVNNNDGTWAPQIIYAVQDRVRHAGQLYEALSVHQAQPGQTPANRPDLWQPLPMTACGQLVEFCDEGGVAADQCQAVGVAADEAACLANLGGCLPACLTEIRATPCSGLCNNPISFSVPDGSTFQSGSLGTGEACYETESEILTGSCSGFTNGRQLSVNGTALQCASGQRPFPYPLPPQRNHGYCFQVPSGSGTTARFSAQ
jgi:spore coat protein A, manganese oxidase